jgi:hypothetical protein
VQDGPTRGQKIHATSKLIFAFGSFSVYAGIGLTAILAHVERLEVCIEQYAQ